MPWLLSLALITTSHAADTAASFQQVTAGDGLGLHLEMQITRGGSTSDWGPVSAPIYDGDLVALRFTPSESGYVTLINHGTSGKWSLIYPATPAELLKITPDAPARVPAEGGNFPVSPPAGAEGIYLMLSPEPPGPEVAQLLTELINSQSASPPAPTTETGTAEEPAPIVALAFRSLTFRDLGSATYAVEETPISTGLRVSFDLDHRAGAGPALP